MIKKKTVFIVHSIDTEGPLYESIDETFVRLKNIFGIKINPGKETLWKLQNKEMNLGGIEDDVAKVVAPELLNYNSDYGQLDKMLDRVMSKKFTAKTPDSYGGEWIYNWHCVDHIGYTNNPRRKDIGIHNIFDYYRQKIRDYETRDEIHWHFHPSHHKKTSHYNATNYFRDNKFYEILGRRIIERNWFPAINRAGYHTERPDSHWILEQWIPFDLSNQSFDHADEQKDVANGRFGDWRRAPKNWGIYHPDYDDYQVNGSCKRVIGRCLNIGTRFRCIDDDEIRKAFRNAGENDYAMLGITNHDFRDFGDDISNFMIRVKEISEEFPGIQFKYSGAREAFNYLKYGNCDKKQEQILSVNLIPVDTNSFRINVKANQKIFGVQPFLTVQTKSGHYYHDNFDFETPFLEWNYTFDVQTFEADEIKNIGIATNDIYGDYHIIVVSDKEILTALAKKSE